MKSVQKLEPGVRIQDYVLRERLGQGAFGEVWRADHAHLPRTAAIKFATSEAGAKALEREGVCQFGLDHEGIVKVLDANLSFEPPYVILEHVEGKSLRQLLRERGRLEMPDATSIFRQLCGAVAFAHKRGVVHGDVKPENVIVTPKGQAKLTDFGLGFAAAREPAARDAGGGGDVRPSFGTDVAAASPGAGGAPSPVLGTYHYLAPEQEAGGPVDGRADIYALGVVLFEMLTGSLPQGRDLPSDLNPAISWWWDHIFARCYAGKERRYGCMGELEDDLRCALTGPRWGEMPSQVAAVREARSGPEGFGHGHGHGSHDPSRAAAYAARLATRASEERRAPCRPARPGAAVFFVALLAVILPALLVGPRLARCRAPARAPHPLVLELRECEQALRRAEYGSMDWIRLNALKGELEKTMERWRVRRR